MYTFNVRDYIDLYILKICCIVDLLYCRRLLLKLKSRYIKSLLRGCVWYFNYNKLNGCEQLQLSDEN